MKQTKRFLIHIFTAILVVLFSISAAAANIHVTYNGTNLAFDTPPQLVNGRAMVPMRTIFEALGYDVTWEENGQYIYGKKDGTLITLQVDNPYAWINESTVKLDSPPYLASGRAMVPLRFLAETTGLNVSWSESTQTAALSGPEDNDNRTINDSVVMINTNLTQGSGFFITSDGVIVTNSHVLEDASRLSITFQNGTTYTGAVSLIGYDRARDIAAIKIDGASYHPVILGDSNAVTKGEKVTAVSSPNGSLNQSSTGVVLGKNTSAIATSAVIDHGSSGGALFNSAGEVIGIISSYDDKGQYFSIPINDLKNIPAINAQLHPSDGHSYPLEPLSAFPRSTESITPTGLAVSYESDITYLTWNSSYQADYYLLYVSGTKDGTYTPVINPLTGQNTWYWGFPYSFGITGRNKTLYYKIASSHDGVMSELSAPVLVQLP